MKTFDIDLGLDRYRNDKSDGEPYFSRGVKIQVRDDVLTRYDRKRTEQEDPDYLGAYVDMIWNNIATAAIELDRKETVKFEIITEGWDPEFTISNRKNGKLEIAMSEESANWSDNIEIPKKYTEGITIDAEDFIDEVLQSGKELREFYKERDLRSHFISNLDEKIEKLEELAENKN